MDIDSVFLTDYQYASALHGEGKAEDALPYFVSALVKEVIFSTYCLALIDTGNWVKTSKAINNSIEVFIPALEDARL